MNKYEEDIIIDTIFNMNEFREYKAIQYILGPSMKPRGIKQWARYLWGYDIWVGSVPLIKTIVFVNVIVWLLFA